MKKYLLMALMLTVTAISLAPAEEKPDYLDLAIRIADTVERTALHQETQLYSGKIDTETGTPSIKSDAHYSNWYFPGLWMLYWKTGDQKFLDRIQRQSDNLWAKAVDDKTGLPWLKFDLAKQKPIGDEVSHRIQYQNLARGNWDNYLRSLRSANQYQVVSDGGGRRMLVNSVSAARPGFPAGKRAPDYFGCLDLRIPYALGTIDQDPSRYQAVVDDFEAHLYNPVPKTTGLWAGMMIAPLFGPFISSNLWTGTIADDTYTGLILADLTGRSELHDMVVSQSRLAHKYCYHPDRHYFYQGVNTVTGKVLDNSPRYHTNWEWALTYFILFHQTAELEFQTTALENYQWLLDSLDHPGNYSTAQGEDWNVPQIALLSLYVYHLTQDPKYLDDARMIADHLIKNRLRFEGENVYVGLDRLENLRDAGDFIAMLTCLSDDSHPVISSRYFLFPVGIRSPSFPVFEDASVARFHTRDDGVLEAKITGGAGQREDLWVQDLSGPVQWVKVNGQAVEWTEREVAGQRYVVIGQVELGDVKIEILSPSELIEAP